MVAMPFFVPYCLLTGKSLDSLRQRFGLLFPVYAWHHTKRLWFHAASVGEVQAAKALISTLHSRGVRADIIISTVTDQGQLAAARQLEHAALCLYAPVDLPWVIERFIRKLQPSVYICLETELWPNMLRLAHAHGIKTLLLNGRLSETSFQRYRKIKGFMGQVLGDFQAAAVIQDIDRKRYVALGVDPAKITVQGNVKYDLRVESFLAGHGSRPAQADAALRETVARQYQELLGIAHDQPVLLAGSTHTGEEALMLAAHAALAETIPNLVLVIAPRHLDRLSQLKADWQSAGLSFQTLTQVLEGQRTATIILIDRMGELAKLYAVATYVFCGGSLVARGGHNIMEAAIWGKPPMYGPHMHDFSDARALLESQEAGFTINTLQELIERIRFFHRHQDLYRQTAQRTLAIAAAQQGAAAKQAEIICQALG